MPAYSYIERFVPLVINATKTQTIRKRRRYPAKPGDTLYHYFGLRTKWCKKLGESICKEVKTILITKNSSVIIYDRRVNDDELKKALRGNLMGRKLSRFEFNLLAYNDGFRVEPTWQCGVVMMKWWKQTHELPFIGDIILWDAKTFVKVKK